MGVGVDEIWLEADAEEDDALDDEPEVEAVFYSDASVSAILDKQKMITEVDDEESEEAWLAVVAVGTPSVGVVIVVAGVEDETWVGVGAFVPVEGCENGST